jgi:hypothetical protein
MCLKKFIKLLRHSRRKKLFMKCEIDYRLVSDTDTIIFRLLAE